MADTTSCSKDSKKSATTFEDASKQASDIAAGTCELEGFLAGPTIIEAFAPGRTELAGNHVDHQGGVVIAATISKGIRGKACENGRNEIRVKSEGFSPFTVDLGALRATEEPQYEYFGTSKSLVAGMVVALEKQDHQERGEGAAKVRGFDLHVTSDLPAGGGLSSSAAFELLVGVILNALYFKGRFSALDLALAAQNAETVYFGKPCGLMDQAAIAFGGVVQMDFTGETPVVTPLNFDFNSAGLGVVLVDVHADHAQATPEYASIPRDMKAAARICGAERLGETSQERLLGRLVDIRHTLGDMAALRSLHYLREVELVRTRAAALNRCDIASYCQATAFSAASSAQYLQNVSELGAAQQPAMLALALADLVLDNMAREAHYDSCGAWPRGVARIHGGGFGGSIQAYLPTQRTKEFAKRIDRQLGAGSATILTITDKGAYASWM